MSRRDARKTSTKIRCAIYTRKSTEEGLDLEFNTLDAQRESAEAYIASQKCEGWVCLPDRFDDGGFSGGNIQRPALKRLMDDIEKGEVDCVVVYKVDRLSRSLMDFSRLMETFEKHNISFVSVTQQFNTTHSMGRLTLNILLSFAQFEREIIGERIRDKISAQRRRGKWTGGTPILGYDVDRTNASPRLVVNATEASRVQTIFDLYLHFGSLLPVVDELNHRDWRNKAWRTKKGDAKGDRPFDKGSLYALLTNPLYIGKIRHKKDMFDGEHEPIVTTDVFRKVQTRLRQNGRNGGIEVRNRHGALLKQLLKCKACGRTMTHTFTGKGSRRYRYYVCTAAISKGRKRCPSPSLPAGEIEATVVDSIRCIGPDRALRKEVLKQGQSQDDIELKRLRQELSGLERELGRHHADIQRLATGIEQGAATTALIADLHDRIDKSGTRIRELRTKIAEIEKQRLSRQDVDAAFEDFDELWTALSPREQSQLLALLIERVEFDVSDSSLSLHFHDSGIKALANNEQEDAA